MRLFDGAIDSVRRDLIFLAPARGRMPSVGWRMRSDDGHYARLLSDVQKLRGRVYLEEGAISEAQLTADGRHWQAVDSASWHLVALDRRGQVCGCARYSHFPREIGFQHLGVRTSALARSEHWGMTLRAAVEREIADAHGRGVAFAEVGGWAMEEPHRFTGAALRIALATYALAQLLGGCVGLTTATVRHRSSQILRRIGGSSLSFGETELPAYYDPQYQCQMEVLRFDSAHPDPAFRGCIDRLREQLRSVTVVAPGYAPALPYPTTIRPVPSLEPQLWPAVS